MNPLKETELREGFENNPELAGKNGYCNPIMAKNIADYWLKILSREIEAERERISTELRDRIEDWKQITLDKNVANGAIIALKDTLLFINKKS